MSDRDQLIITTRTDLSLIDGTAFIAPGATVLGRVQMDAESSVWFGAVLRGDIERIVLGARSNVQDNSVLHCDPGTPCRIGSGVTIGHGAIVHGAIVGDDALIGIGAIVLNGAQIGCGAIVAAGALVTENFVVPPGMVVMGSPAKVIKPVSEAQRERIAEGTAHYVQAARKWKRAFELDTQK